LSREEVAAGPVGAVLSAHLATHLQDLYRHDRGLRRSEQESVHRMRIAARRLRAALTTYRPLLRPDAVDPLREELRWLGQVLGPARDAHVLRTHLEEAVAAQPADLVLGPVVSRLVGELGAAEQAGLTAAREALDSDRYLRLLDALDSLVDSPPLAAGSEDVTAGDAVPRLLARDAKRVRKAASRLRPAEEAEPADESAQGRGAGEVAGHEGDDHDAALHEVRKKAKRLRYAAESAVPVVGKRGRRLAKRAKRVQSALGEHQDAVVARAVLRDLGVRAHLAGENGFTFGRLHALEERRADRAEDQFGKAWDRLHLKRIRRRLR
jgi:CHAD domain-containing protein